MPQGPYKHYECDPALRVPKTTSYNGRKRNFQEVEEAESSLTHGADDSHMVDKNYGLNSINYIFFFLNYL